MIADDFDDIAHKMFLLEHQRENVRRTMERNAQALASLAETYAEIGIPFPWAATPEPEPLQISDEWIGFAPFHPTRTP